MTRTTFRPRLIFLDERIVPSAAADLAVTITDGQDPVVAGTNLTYTIAVTNNGPDDAHDVFLRDLIPVNTSVLSFTAPAGWTTTAPPPGVYGAVTAALPTLAFGAPTQIFTLTVHVLPAAFSGIYLNNNATIASSTVDPDSANNDVDERTIVRPYPTPLVTGADAGGGPHVKVFDPFSGALKFSFYAYDASFTGGVRVASADVTGDYIPDIITGAGPGGGPHVKVFDGVTGALVRSFYAYDAAFTGGVFVAAADMDSDYRAEIITGADAGGGPDVRVFAGVDGSLLRSFYAYDSNFRGGVRVAAADVQGLSYSASGCCVADIITGAGPGGGPNVRVFSGQTFAKLRDYYAYDASYTGGVTVAAGDLDKDGHAEIITGAGPGLGRAVNVFRGSDGALIQSFLGYGSSFAGSVRVGIADVGGDGQLDILTGAGPGGGPHAIARQGKTLDILTSFYAYDPGFTGGVWVG